MKIHYTVNYTQRCAIAAILKGVIAHLVDIGHHKVADIATEALERLEDADDLDVAPEAQQ